MLHTHRRGIALISGLFVMVAVVLLGVGAVFLSTSSLRVAENVRGEATARAAAESGLDVAYLVLSAIHAADGAFPASRPTLPADSTYALVDYRRDGPGQAFVQVLGTASGGAEYVAEALIRLVAQPPTVNPVYDLGLASEGTVTVTSGASVYLDAGVHGNSGFSLKGGFESCIDRDEFGVCLTREPLLGTPPVSLSDPRGPCSFPGGACSNVADFLAPEISVSSDYTGRRNRAADLDGDGNFDAGDCAGKPSTATNVMNHAEICAAGTVSLNNPVLNDVIIVAQGNITLSGNARLTNTTLISLNGTVSIASGTMEGTSIYSQKSVTFSGNAGNYVWNGSNTIATGGDITFNGANKNSNTVNPVAQDDGTKAVGLVLISDGDVTFNGRNSGSDKYYAVWIVGGDFTQNGRSEVYGSVAAVGDIRFNGNFFIDSGLGVVNDEVSVAHPPVVAVVSRR